MTQPDISIVIPFLNEEENVNNLIEKLGVYLGSRRENIEVVLVDDGSTDGSVAALKALMPIGFPCSLVRLSRNFGSLAALQAGIKHARGKATIFLYADLQDPIDLVGRLYEKFIEGYQIAWASRRFAYRESRFFSKAYAWLMRRYAVPNFPENGFDVVMFSEQVRVELNQHPENNSSIFLQILNLGFPQCSILYDKTARKAGVSKWNFAKKFKLVVDSFVAFSFAPIRLVTMLGLAMAAIGFFWTIYIVAYTLLVGGLPLGVPALISISLIGFGVTNISLGIIAEYLWRTLDAARGRSPFVVQSVENLSNHGA